MGVKERFLRLLGGGPEFVATDDAADRRTRQLRHQAQGVINIRPRGSSDPFSVYSPNRDLANVGGQLLQKAYETCTESGVPSCVTSLLSLVDGNVDAAQVGVACLAEACNKTVTPGPEQMTIRDALAASGFTSLTEATQAAALAHVGAVCVALIAHCIKDVTYVGEDAPHLDQVRRVVEQARDMARDAFDASRSSALRSDNDDVVDLLLGC